ncbi:MAG: hypothetical protein EB167_00140 [Nitrososphaeria archaeon]|nr:hypothetical protein [Nitrososphaeria archaeon]
MAKIRLKLGDNEIEIDSRDFYVDNDTLPQVIADLTARLQESSDKVEPEFKVSGITETYEKNMDYLQMLRNAEVHEPEFTAPTGITPEELPSRIEELEMNGFFAKPRTVSETVEQLLQHGWIASPLAVSKTLSKMAFNRELWRQV